jgi:urease accessory protein
MNGRSGIRRGSGLPSPILETAAPNIPFTLLTIESATGEARSRTTLEGRGQRMRDTAPLSYFCDDTSAFDTRAPGPDNLSDKDLQRSEGSCRIVLGSSERGTRVMDVYQRSPIRVLFPRTAGTQVQEAVLVNTSGGIAGGDRLESSVTAMDNASITVTTQAAEKVYRAINESAHITTILRARDAAKLAWLPQETIVFNRARVCRCTHIEVSSGSELLALEWLVLGRAAHGEKISAGDIRDSWHVRKDGRLVWADSFRATDEVFPHLSRKALLSDCTAVATLLYFGPDLEERLQFIRDMASSLECQCAATLVGGLMVVRFVAKVSCDLRAVLRNMLQQFGTQHASGPFRVPRMWSC